MSRVTTARNREPWREHLLPAEHQQLSSEGGCARAGLDDLLGIHACRIHGLQILEQNHRNSG